MQEVTKNERAYLWVNNQHYLWFLLQKGRVIRYDKQLGTRFGSSVLTIVEFMFSSFLYAAMVGVYILKDLGIAKLSIKTTVLGLETLLAVLFLELAGRFLATAPALAVGALGEGRWDVVWGLLGMLAGAAIYAGLFR